MPVLEITRAREPHFQSDYATNGGVDKEPDSFHFRYNPENDSVTKAIVEAVALVHNTRHEELVSLVEVIDPEALIDLLHSSSSTLEVVFTYEQLEVTVNSSGDIWLSWASGTDVSGESP